MDRVNAHLLRVLSKIVQEEIADSSDLITLTDATTTRDLKQVTVSISAAQQVGEYVRRLNARKEQIRQKLRPLLDFKVIPYIIFVEDSRGDDINRVEALLDTLP